MMFGSKNRARIAELEAALASERERARVSGRVAAEKVAECDNLTGAFGPMLQIIDRMDEDYGYPAADIATDLALDEKVVRTSMRALQALGLAKRHPFFSEDDNRIHGSGYSLSAAGDKLRSALPDAPKPKANGAAVQAVVL